MRYGIIGEDRSDVDTLKVLVKRISESHSLATPHFHLKGYEGWSQMFSSGVSKLQNFQTLECNRIVICYDADGPEEKAKERRDKVQKEIIVPSGVSIPCCALVPVEELEAWILADVQAVRNVITSLRISKSYSSPERVRDPKEELIRITRCPKRHTELYSPPDHNEHVASHLDLKTVEDKCPSFSGFVTFITGKNREERSVRRRKGRRR